MIVRAARGLLPLLACLACGLLASSAEAKRVRVFAVQPKIEIERWFDTREHYRKKLLALLDRTRRGGPDVPLIQRGADDVASHLLGPRDPDHPVRTARDLVALPEDVGLWTMLTGTRGAQARAIPPDPNSSSAAVASLGVPYGPLLSYYEAKFPELASRGVPGRTLIVAITDQFARVAVETFARLADRYDVYLEAGVDMARDWRVVCDDKQAFNSADPPRLPGGVRCEKQDPATVALLRSPDEPGRDYAYEATSPDAVNMALIFDPDGRLISKQVKAYLTPIELPGVGLDLKPGAVSALGAVRTPVGRIGVVTSKDAWMPDVQARLDQRRVDVLIQPEYFTGDTVRTQGPWGPDTLQAAGYNDVLRRPSFEAMVLPELTGNAFDLPADAQSHIAARARSKRTPKRAALVGQPLQRGFARVSRWSVADPLFAGEPFPDRRARLGEAGEAILPGSGVECPDPAVAGPCEGGQVEDVLHADVRLRRAPDRHPYRGPRRDSPFSANRVIHHSPYPQRNVALAAFGRRVLTAFEEIHGGRSRVLVGRSGDRGRSFAPPVARPGGSAGGQQWNPSVAISRRHVFCAWTDDRAGPQRVEVAISHDGGRSFGGPLAVPQTDAAPGDHRQWLPALAADGDGGAYLAYLEEDDLSADDGLPQTRVLFRRIEPDGSLGPVQRLDEDQPDPLAAKLDHSWAPSIDARGDRVTVAWVDFRTYDWRPYARTSGDGGASFAPEQDVSSAYALDPAPLEQLADSPSVAVGARRTYVAWSDWRKEEDTNVRPSSAYDTWLATSVAGGFQPDVRVDDRGARQASTFWPAAVVKGGDALVAWQDSASGSGDIRMARVIRGAERGDAARVDDTGHAGVNQYRPALALAGRSLFAAWEDERNGPPQIYAARAPANRIR